MDKELERLVEFRKVMKKTGHLPPLVAEAIDAAIAERKAELG